jgi:tetratricopeptide (TPR) repeat protein
LSRLLPDVARPGLPPPGDSDLRLFESVAQLVEHLAAQRPVVLFLEDVHWADEMSLRLPAFVSRRVRGGAVLVVATAREEELVEAARARRTLGELARQPDTVPLTLALLSRPDITCLVEALARAGTETDELARLDAQVWAVSEGNPLVAIETIRALQEGSIRQGSSSLPIPQRVRDLVAGRLERLSDRAQRLVEVAAVTGREFEFGVLQRSVGLPEVEVAEGVEELVRCHILHATGERLDFTHDRIRAVAYDRLLPSRRRLLHAKVAGAIEQRREIHARLVGTIEVLHRDRIGEQIEHLAHHALRGELGEKAARYLRQAGVKAAARSALLDARVWFEQALDVLARLPESASTLEQAFEVRLEMRPILSQLGELQGMLGRLREAEAFAERLNDDRRRGRVYAFMTVAHTVGGELDAALAAGARALGIAGRLGDLKLRLVSMTYLEQAHHYRGDYERSVELALDNLAALPTDWIHETLGNAAPISIYDRIWLLCGLGELGRFAEAASYELEVLRIADATQHAYSIGQANLASARPHLLRGNWERARSLLEHGISAYRAGNITLSFATMVAQSAWILAQLGETCEALSRLREGEQLIERDVARGILFQQAPAYRSLGRAALLLGRLEQARSLGERAARCCQSQAGFRAHALYLMGDVATHPDLFDAQSGKAHYRQALALAEPRGMRPLMANCHLGLGKLYQRTGEHGQAREHLTTATTMYREMDMRFWLEQAEAEMGGPA